MKFIARRAAYAVFLLVSVSALSVAVLKFTPGDYYTSVRVDPQISNKSIAAMRAEYGLDKPLPALYWTWLRSVTKGDWGFSFAYGCAAAPILWPRARNTLLLAISATFIAWLIALPAGIVAAAHRGGWADMLTTAAAALLLGIPEVVLALLLLLFAARTHYPLPGTTAFPVGTGHMDFPAGLTDEVKRLFLPAICLGAALMPLLFSHIRASLAETLRAPFVTAARSFGIPYPRILLQYAFRASLNAIISLFGLSVGLLMSSSLIVEGVFSWPGLGQLMLQAISDRDMFLIVDSAILSAAFLVVGNFAADVLLYVSDPRIRTKSPFSPREVSARLPCLRGPMASFSPPAFSRRTVTRARTGNWHLPRQPKFTSLTRRADFI